MKVNQKRTGRQKVNEKVNERKQGFRFYSETLSFICAPRRARTFDLRIKSQLLYQLSYRSSARILSSRNLAAKFPGGISKDGTDFES